MRLIWGLMMFAILTVSAHAEFKSEDELGEWVTYYYMKPSPSQIPYAVEFMSKAGWLDNEKSISPIFGFLAGGFRENPEQVPEWIDRLSALPESHFGVVVLGLWYANLPDSQEQVYEILENHPGLKNEFSFLATGTPMPIEKITSGARAMGVGRFMG